MSYSFLGCDPGAKGAICALVPEENIIEFLPTTINPQLLLNMLNSLNTKYPIKKIMLEEVHSVPNASAKANFVFGRNLERMQTVFLIAKFGLDFVQPKEWQKFIGVKPAPRKKKGAVAVKANVRTTALKKEIAQIASRLYPEAELHGPKGGLLDGRSDALMICHYNYLKYK